MKKTKWIILCAAVLIFLATQAEASIVLKVIAVNPSQDQEQKASVKAYLPKETKPDEIIDKGDLEVSYDTQQGSYYVFGEYNLKPGEVKEINIELKDIWSIPDSEIEALRAETNKIEGMVKNTEFADRMNFLKTSIMAKLNQVSEAQKNSPANPERHISEYRENLKIIESVKSDLVLARSLMMQVRALPTATIWRLILAIIIFLGVLGAGFYIIWQKQVKIVSDDTFYVPKDEINKDEASANPNDADKGAPKTEK